MGIIIPNLPGHGETPVSWTGRGVEAHNTKRRTVFFHWVPEKSQRSFSFLKGDLNQKANCHVAEVAERP